MNISSITIIYKDWDSFTLNEYANGQCIDEDDAVMTSDESALSITYTSETNVNVIFESLYVSYLDDDDEISSFTVNVKK